MLKHIVKLNDSIDSTIVLEEFRLKCSHYGLTDSETQHLCGQVEQTMTEFTGRGRQLSDLGSQLHVTRKIEYYGHEVIIKANFGQRKSLLKKLLSVVGL
jgi:hypothetical protein